MEGQEHVFRYTRSNVPGFEEPLWEHVEKGADGSRRIHHYVVSPDSPMIPTSSDEWYKGVEGAIFIRSKRGRHKSIWMTLVEKVEAPAGLAQTSETSVQPLERMPRRRASANGFDHHAA